MSRLLWIPLLLLGGGLVLLIANDSAGTVFGIENHRFARLLALGVLGVLVGTGLLRRRMPLTETVRNIGVWVLVALLLVAGYQFRYELQDVASRVSAGLVPGSPISTVDAEGRESVYVERMPGGHFETRASVNGVAVSVIIDTGASATVLTAEDASRIGLDPERMSFWIPVATANGATQAARARIRELGVGAITRRDVSVLVARPGALERSLLGMNFIGSLSGFDMRGDRLILRD